MDNFIKIFFPHYIYKEIIQFWMNNVGNLKDLSYVFLNVALCISAYKGLGYIKTFEEKKNTATFTYWVQLRIRLLIIKGWLEEDNNLINFLFGEESRATWESEVGADKQRIEKFLDIVEETIHFIKTTPDQIPAYNGWTDDYNKLIIFLREITLFDISNGKCYFKFNGINNIKERNDYCKDICSVIERMCNGIMHKQAEIEGRINI